jgi:hypothetical protein
MGKKMEQVRITLPCVLRLLFNYCFVDVNAKDLNFFTIQL